MTRVTMKVFKYFAESAYTIIKQWEEYQILVRDVHDRQRSFESQFE